MNQEDLMACLSELPAVELKAVQLLRELTAFSGGTVFPPPVPPQRKAEAVEATVELIGYSQRCTEVVRKVSQLQPVPLLDESLVEYVL